MTAPAGDTTRLAREHTRAAWNTHQRLYGWTNPITDWAPADGHPLMLEAQIGGSDALEALHAFTGNYLLINTVADLGGQVPTVDYDTPGQFALVWRVGAVWMRLWCADSGRVPDPVLVRYGPKPDRQDATGGVQAAA